MGVALAGDDRLGRRLTGFFLGTDAVARRVADDHDEVEAGAAPPGEAVVVLPGLRTSAMTVAADWLPEPLKRLLKNDVIPAVGEVAFDDVVVRFRIGG